MAAPKYLERDPVSGQVQEVIATETGPASEVIVSTTPSGTIDPSLLPSSGNKVTQVQIDFGTLPVSEMLFMISDPAVSPGSHITGQIAYDVGTTGKDLDEFEMDAIDLKFGQCSTGQFEVYAIGLEGYVSDKFMLNYIVG